MNATVECLCSAVVFVFYIDGVFLMYWRLSLRVSKNRDE